jgi:prolipoprotein diacylglyceryltransferase
MQEVELATLTLSLTAYYFIERCLRLILKAHNTPFYESLRASRKDLVFFGIWMGLLITIISTPFCVRGAREEWSALKDLPANSQPDGFGSNAKVCVAARSVLWVSELNRLDLYGIYVVHHAGSILSLLSFLYFEWPAAIFLTIYSTLVSEIPGDLVWMVSSYIETFNSCSPSLTRFKSRLAAFNVAQYALIRGTGLAVVCWMLWTNQTSGLHGRPALEQVYAYSLLGLYTVFCGYYIFGQYKKNRYRAHTPSDVSHLKPVTSQLLQVPADPKQEWSRPVQLRIGRNPPIIIIPYGLFMGIGFAALVLVSLSIGAPSDQGLEDLSFALNLTLVYAVLCARLLSITMDDGFSALVSCPIRTLLRPGFWLHGGLFGATAGAVFAYKLGYVHDFPVFVGSLAIGLPLYETFSRIGCHTYGCCYGRVADHAVQSGTLWRLFPYPPVRYSHPTDYAATRANPRLLHQPLIPIQLISATLFLLLFLGIALPLAHYTSVEVAGATTLICHAGLRVITEAYRADYRGREGQWLSVTGKMALVQAKGAMAWLVSSLTAHGGMQRTRWLEQLEPSNFLAKERLLGPLFAATLGVVVYGVHVGDIGSWVETKVDGQSLQNGATKGEQVFLAGFQPVHSGT